MEPSGRVGRRNFFWAVMNGALFEFGASFADVGTVVTAFLGRLTSGALAVGAAAAIARFGWLLPQLFAANYARRMRYRKPLYLIGGGGRALCLGLLAAAVFAWPGGDGQPVAMRLAVFFGLWTAFSFVAGLSGVPYNDVIARTIPSDRRSRLLGLRLFIGGALAAGGGLLIRAILHDAPPASLQPYGLIFGAGALVLAASTLCFAQIEEPAAPVQPTRPGFGLFLREGIQVVRADRRFRLFLYAQLLGGVTKMSAPFYLLQALRVSQLPELEVGTLLAAQMIGTVALNPVLGWWGDRYGKRSLLQVVTVLSVVSPLLAIGAAADGSAPSDVILWYALVFFFLGVATTGEIIGDLGYLMEISPDARRPEYSGYMNALVAPSRLLPLLGGALVALGSFQLLFAASALAVAARLRIVARLGSPSPSRAER